MARLALRRTRAIETKYLQQVGQTSAYGGSSSLIKIDMPAQGDGLDNRDGDSIVVKHFRIQVSAAAPGVTQLNKEFGTRARVLLVCWKEDSTMGEADIFNPPQYKYNYLGAVTLAQQKRTFIPNLSKSRVEILYDSTRLCVAHTNDQTSAWGTNNIQPNFTITIPIEKKNTKSAGTWKQDYYLVFMSDYADSTHGIINYAYDSWMKFSG